MQRRPFKKRYVENWSEKLFVVGTRLSTSPVTYMLKDLAGNDINNVLYTDELYFVTKLDDALFDMKRIVKTRK